MTADATSSYFPSMPPTFGWRRVVELADEFKVSTADMLAICDRLGIVVEDASEWLAPETVDLIRDVVAVGGPTALLNPPAPPQLPKPEKLRVPKPPKPEKLRAEKPPKPEKVRAEKPPKPEKPAKPPRVKAEKPPKPPKPEKVRAEKAPKPEKPPKPEQVRAEKAPKPEKVRAEKLPKPEKVRAEKAPKPEKLPKAPKPEKVRAEKAPKPEKLPKPPKVKAQKSSISAQASEVPAVGSVTHDGVRTRRVVLIGLVIGVLALASGVLVERWVDYVTSTDAPATVVTTEPR